MTTEYLLNREVGHVLAALMPSNQLVIQLCLHTGARLSDVLELKTEQLKSRFWYTEKKTGKRRLMGIPRPLLDEIKRQSGEVWAFPGRDGKRHRTRQAVWKDVKRAAVAFRLPQNVGPHSFRKVYAVDLLQKYGNIDKVRRNLNHGSNTVTAIYAMADVLLATKCVKKPMRYGRRK